MQASENEAIRRDLAKLVGERHVTTSQATAALYGRDCWPRGLLRERTFERPFHPDLVCWPGSTDEVARVVRYARRHLLPITPFGAGSSVVGGALPLRAGITLDLKRLRRTLAVDLPGRRARVQAGMVGSRLEEALGQQGATAGHFPQSITTSTVGGWIATRGAGQMSSYYGKIEDIVLGVTAVAGTGDVLRAGPERAPGPDLVQLLTGSEGSLAVITEATLAIQPKPAVSALRAFRLKHLESGVAAMRCILRAGLRPHVIRLYDPLDSVLAVEPANRRKSDVPAPLRAAIQALRARSLGYVLAAPSLFNRAADLVSPRCLLVVSFEGEHLVRVEEQLRECVDLVRDAGGVDLGDGPARRWYDRRWSLPYKQAAIFAGRAWTDTMEVAATWERLPRVIDAVKRAVWGEAFVITHLAHPYLEGGSAYFTFIGPATTVERGEASYDATWRAAQRAALDAGATLSHHHGVGAMKGRFLPDELGDAGMRLLRALKHSFDPDGILNPGKLVT
jgi:alkyldihydroxyacetonephosphate synthase